MNRPRLFGFSRPRGSRGLSCFLVTLKKVSAALVPGATLDTNSVELAVATKFRESSLLTSHGRRLPRSLGTLENNDEYPSSSNFARVRVGDCLLRSIR